MDSKDAELADAMKRYTLHSMQQYRTWYLLAKLTRFVETAFKGSKGPVGLSDFIGLQIEHILPNTPDEELLKSFTDANPGKAYDDYKARLGNLTLLEKPLNAVAGRNFFEKKKPIYRVSGPYLTRSIDQLADVGQCNSVTKINKRLKCFDQWTAGDIESRQEMLIGLAKDVWKTAAIEVR